MIPIRKVQPGDLLDIVEKFRLLMSACDNASFALYASFDELGGAELEDHAVKARRALELSAARMFALLGHVESDPRFADLRKRIQQVRAEKTRAAVSED